MTEELRRILNPPKLGEPAPGICKVRPTISPNYESLAELLRRSTPGVPLRPLEEEK